MFMSRQQALDIGAPRNTHIYLKHVDMTDKQTGTVYTMSLINYRQAVNHTRDPTARKPTAAEHHTNSTYSMDKHKLGQECTWEYKVCVCVCVCMCVYIYGLWVCVYVRQRENVCVYICMVCV